MSSKIRLVCSMLVCVLLIGCGVAPTPTSDTPSANDDTTAEGDTLRTTHPVIWGGVESLDPASSTVFYMSTRMLYDTLVRPDENYDPAPSLATNWEANDDATVWTFTLRDDVVFHDGTPFTSADVAYTFERFLSPDSDSLLSAVINIIDSIETPDDQTVVFNLSEPHAELPVLFLPLYSSIIPENSSETIGETGIGTGPFKLETLDPEGTTYLVANDDYWQGTPGLDAIELIGIPDADARLQALQAGQVNLMFDLTPQQATILEGNDDLIVQQFISGDWSSITMRADTPPFDDVRVRKALRLAANRQEMIDLVLQGEGSIACDSVVWPGDPHRWEGECEQDIEQARELLSDAGYPDGLDVTLYTSNSFPSMVPLAEVYQQQAAEAGINVTIEQISPDSYWTEIWGAEPLVVDGYSLLPADFGLYLTYSPDSFYNIAYFDNAEFMQLLADARATLDPEERTDLYQQAQQLLFEEGGTLIPFHVTEMRAFYDNISGIEPVTYYDLPWHTITKVEE